ncbi:MAG: hypothetical protein K9I94_15855 [Bacteroidales bacterium]|nr:hypothetical protein [Bacteroidales bacterium]
MPPQLKTLIPLFILFILAFLIARHFLVPDSFGKEGHYRFESVEDNKEMPMFYAGNEACAECHDKAAEMEYDMHADLTCETCHGPGMAHYENPDNKLIMPRDRSFCGLCHASNNTRKYKLAQVDLEEHNPGMKCVECHNPHLPWEIAE